MLLKTKSFRFITFCMSGVFLVCVLFVQPYNAYSQSLTIDELRQKINETQAEKARLEEENKKLEQQIQKTGQEAKTLQSAVKSLEATGQKLQSDIKVTQTKINGAELTIQKLGIEISNTEEKIGQGRQAIAESIRRMNEADSKSMAEIILEKENFNEVWDDVESIIRVQESVRDHVSDLALLRSDLQGKKSENEIQKNSLVNYREDLSDQKSAIEENKKVKNVLLTNTKNKEAEYKKLLERNIELGKKFEEELFRYESELQIKIDRSKLPNEGGDVLSWPLESIYITQKFGRTIDAKRLYVSGTHNGVDFRASVGTAVKAVYSGIVKGIGNTDDQPGCYSYGAWVLLEHPNGLSSLYAHLSSIKVSAGQEVVRGQTIGLSGGQPGIPGAGYSTGPHLHLGLFASEGVRIQKYTSSSYCKKVSIPIASTNAYLDPLAYLPAI